MREVRGLKWAKVIGEERPKVIPQGRPRGVKATGVRFEKAVASRLDGAKRGIWWEFEDENGHGFAQTDFWFAGESPVIAESKLTWHVGAYMQLRRLYFPLARWLFGPVGGFVVCRNVTRETPQAMVTGDLAEALDRARHGEIPVLHWPLIRG